MAYTIVDGKIQTPEGCELNVVSHCNLACRSCSHLAPVMSKSFVDVDSVFRDFSTLAKYFRPQYVKILGGEPLLHSNLLDIIDAIRRSGICEHIQVCTNGILLPRMLPPFWTKVNEIHMSIYPGKELNAEQLTYVRQQAQDYNVDLKLFYFDHFRESYSEIGTSDEQLVQRIYRTCQIAHVWRCHTVFNGYLFKCPQSIYIPQV